MGNSSNLMILDLSEYKMGLLEMIQTAQIVRGNTELQILNICSNTGIKFYPEAEFIIDVILSVNSKLSEVVINGTNIRPRLLSCSRVLTSNDDMNFSLQHLYMADKFPLYLGLSYAFKDNFVTCLSKNKKMVKVEEECPFDHAEIFTHYIDCEGGVYYYKDHDVALFVPPGAILQNDYVEIKVSSSLYGQFHMPQNHNRISSYVWVGASYKFEAPVYLIINHFVDIKSVKNIKALTVFEACKLYGNRNNGGGVVMHEVPTSYFDSDLKYCIIPTDHFCTYCLSELKKSSNQICESPKLFVASYYSYEEAERGITYIIAEICCSYLNNNCVQVHSYISKIC